MQKTGKGTTIVIVTAMGFLQEVECMEVTLTSIDVSF